jgi:6-phosphofructokinase 1
MSVSNGANLLVIHGGGPTSVINASLYGVIQEARKHHAEIHGTYGAKGGVGGALKEEFIDFKQQSEEDIDRLLCTPASAIGTSRMELCKEDYEELVQRLVKNKIKYLLFNGGNGSMDTCGKIYKIAQKHGIQVIGIPKTIDNDIAVTDHSPGFGSAARYIAASTAEVAEDVKSLPIHVSIIEAMGRNSGWITGASALARQKKGEAPHLIYLPERPFYEENFLADVKALYKKLGGVVVVASEGLKNKQGQSIVPPVFKKGRSIYFGDVSSYLALLVIKKLGIKARSEKPGILGRASIEYQSSVDREEAEMAGRYAVKAIVAGETGKMVGFKRIAADIYQCEPILIPLEDVMMYEKKVPDAFINARGNDVNEEFLAYCRPLIGSDLPIFSNLK